MQHAFDITVDYCKTREQFGKKIGDFQLMQGKMADMYMKLQSSRAFLYALAANADDGIFSNTVKLKKIIYFIKGLCFSFHSLRRKFSGFGFGGYPSSWWKWLY